MTTTELAEVLAKHAARHGVTPGRDREKRDTVFDDQPDIDFEPLRCRECGTLLDGFDCPACAEAKPEHPRKRRNLRAWRGNRLARLLSNRVTLTPRQRARAEQLERSLDDWVPAATLETETAPFQAWAAKVGGAR